MIGRRVIWVHDDSPCPAAGTVTDTETPGMVWVRWDGQLTEHLIFADELAPWGKPSLRLVPRG